MDVRLALYEITERHQLDAGAAADLWRLAAPGRAPFALAYWLPRGVAVLGAALGGLGLIFWIAANWEDFGRVGRFALLQGWFAVMCAGALWRPAARVPLALLAWLATGGLFAYFGQTYQSGADPWQLFALWTALALPLCFAVRSDVLWMPWLLVSLGAVWLWLYTYAGYDVFVPGRNFVLYGAAWAAALLLTALLSPPLRRFTGAGLWALRSAIALSTALVTATALEALFGVAPRALYGLALLILAGAAWFLARPGCADIFGLSAVAMGLNVLLVAGMGRLLDYQGEGPVADLIMLGLVAAALLGATVHWILALARRGAGARA